MSQYPVSPKVQAASLTAAVSGAALWILQTYAFHGAVPDGIASMVYIAVPGALAYAAGWLAPHQSRPSVAVTPLPEPSNVTLSPAAATRHGMYLDPAQVPTTLMTPATQPGQPPAPGYPPQEERLDIKTEPGI